VPPSLQQPLRRTLAATLLAVLIAADMPAAVVLALPTAPVIASTDGESVEEGVSSLHLTRSEAREVVAWLEGLLDVLAPFPWRDQVSRVSVACLPRAEGGCLAGAFVPETRELVLGPEVVTLDGVTLAMLLAHELAHAWQTAAAPAHVPGSSVAAAAVPLPPGVPLLELEADCLASAWVPLPRGWRWSGYWSCPARAVETARAAFEAQGSLESGSPRTFRTGR